MIYEARVVAVHTGIDHRAAIHYEQKRVIVVDVEVLVTPVRFRVCDAVAQILRDARALADSPHCEGALAVHFGTPDPEERRSARWYGCHAQTATGALIAG